MPSLIPRFNSSPLLSACFAQLIGGLLALIFLIIIPEMGQSRWMLAGIQGAGAAITSDRLDAPPWWQGIHLAFVPAALAASHLALQPWVWLAAFALLLLIFGRTDRNRVPLYLTNRTTADALARLLPAHPCFVIDVGCGDGGVVRRLAELRPDSEFVGIEHAVLPFVLARLRTRRLHNAHIRFGDLWGQPLTPYDLAYAFLSPAPMPDLWRKAAGEMRPETTLVSNSFAIPEAHPREVIAVEDRRRSQLYVYRIPASAT